MVTHRSIGMKKFDYFSGIKFPEPLTVARFTRSALDKFHLIAVKFWPKGSHDIVSYKTVHGVLDK